MLIAAFWCAGVLVKEVEQIFARFFQAVGTTRIGRRRISTSAGGMEAFVPEDYNSYRLARFGDAEGSGTSGAVF